MTADIINEKFLFVDPRRGLKVVDDSFGGDRPSMRWVMMRYKSFKLVTSSPCCCLVAWLRRHITSSPLAAFATCAEADDD